MDIKKLVKPNIRKLRAYHAEEVPCRVKLDANESPYGFSLLKTVKTNKYPDPEAKALRKLIARGLRVKPDQVLHGNGSDELIFNLIAAFGGPVMYPVPTFSMYGIISVTLGEQKVEIPLDNEFDLNLKEILSLIKKMNPKIIFLSSPNNPTGNSFSSDRILKIIKQSRGLVVVDEAYQQFSDKKSFIPLLKEYKNLIVLRTLSKIGLAGLRIGFMVADPKIIHEVNKVRLPFNLNALSQKAAIEILDKKERLRTSIRTIVSERKKLLKEMSSLDGITPYPSDANFILFRTNNADEIFNGLLRKGVLIRNMTGAVKNCLRVTVGTPGENRAFLKALKQLL